MELIKGQRLKHRTLANVWIDLLEAKGNGWVFESKENGVKGVWSSRYILSDFVVEE